MGMDLAALRYLLYDIGIPGDLTNKYDNNRNGFHYLGLTFLLSDAHPQSHVFNLLKVNDRARMASSVFIEM